MVKKIEYAEDKGFTEVIMKILNLRIFTVFQNPKILIFDMSQNYCIFVTYSNLYEK